MFIKQSFLLTMFILNPFQAYGYGPKRYSFGNQVTAFSSSNKKSTRNYGLKKKYDKQANRVTSTNLEKHDQNKFSSLVGDYFSRKHNITEILSSVIKHTKKTICGALYVLSCEKLFKSLVEADKNNVKIRLIVDENQAKQKYSLAIELAKQTNAQIYIPQKKYPLMHHKYTIYDDKLVANGSFNWSKNAGGSFNWKENAKNINYENLSIETNPKKVANFKQDFEETLSECLPFKP